MACTKVPGLGDPLISRDALRQRIQSLRQFTTQSNAIIDSLQGYIDKTVAAAPPDDPPAELQTLRDQLEGARQIPERLLDVLDQTVQNVVVRSEESAGGGGAWFTPQSFNMPKAPDFWAVGSDVDEIYSYPSYLVKYMGMNIPTSYNNPFNHTSALASWESYLDSWLTSMALYVQRFSVESHNIAKMLWNVLRELDTAGIIVFEPLLGTWDNTNFFAYGAGDAYPGYWYDNDGYIIS